MLCVDVDDTVAAMQREMDAVVASWSQKPGCPTDWARFDLFDIPTAEREWLQGFVSAVKQMDEHVRQHYMTFHATGQLVLRLWGRERYHGRDRLVASFPGSVPNQTPEIDAMVVPQGEGDIVGFTD